MVLWLKGAFSPQQIRDRLLNPMDGFSKKLVAYLESCFAGDFMMGSQSEVDAMVYGMKEAMECTETPIYKLPTAPPGVCEKSCGECETCESRNDWWEKYQREVDFVDKGKGLLGTFCEKDGKCKARFPRSCYPTTIVDTDTGHIDMKKNEPWLNTVAYIIMTYLLRCNADVTLLLSGTAIKAVIAYITDYISKNLPKTYMVFETIKAVYTRNKQ
ncbi:hypothetical protein BT96DRAFT_780490, partial [Gymnopus androsaceus JB14]